MPRIIRCEECGAEKTISVGNDETKWKCTACSKKPEKATKKVQRRKPESRKSIWTGTVDIPVKKIVHSEKRPLIRKQVLCTVCGSGMIGETKNNTGIQAWGCFFHDNWFVFDANFDWYSYHCSRINIWRKKTVFVGLS